MVDLDKEIDLLVGSLRKGVAPADEGADGAEVARADDAAQHFVVGLFSKSEIPELNRRLEVRDFILKKLATDNSLSFRAAAKEFNCSEDLVTRVWRAIRDQYPPCERVSDTFTMAIPKEERARVLVEDILLESGFRIDPQAKAVIDFKNGLDPIAYRVIRGRDIPVHMKAGTVHFGFLGIDKIIEVQSEAMEMGHDPVEFDVKKQFRQNAFRMCLAVPKTSSIQTIEDLNDKVIATSYVATLKQFLALRNVLPRRIFHLSGGVEEACVDFGADAIMDIVETGTSLKKNNLRVLGVPLYQGNMSILTLKGPVRLTPENRMLDNLVGRLGSVETMKIA